jgi:single-strand DNA-binding protein
MLELTIIGHVGQDATIQEKNGNQFVAFSVAHSNRSVVDTDTGEELRKETTYWVSCTTKQLNLAQYLKKGTQVMVRGNMSLRPYLDDKKEKKVGINLSASLIQLLGKKDKQDQDGAGEPEPAESNGKK